MAWQYEKTLYKNFTFPAETFIAKYDMLILGNSSIKGIGFQLVEDVKEKAALIAKEFTEDGFQDIGKWFDYEKKYINLK